MTHHQFLRIKKLTGKAIIQVAAKHNHREILAEMGAAQGGHIDLSRTSGNILLRGCDTAAGVAGMAQLLMDAADVKPLRKDAVRALEIIFSLPPVTKIDFRRYFDDATQWLEQYFKAPVISAIVHHDEAAPHCHVLLLPLVGGRMIGSRLMGNRSKLQTLQADFHAQAGQRYGLIRQTPHKRLSAAIRRQAIDSAFDVLEANSGLDNSLLRVLVEPHLINPEPLMLALGLATPQPKIKGTFAGIMTKPCKPEKTVGFTRPKPIDFGAAEITEKEQSLSCVGFDNSAQSILPVIELHDDAIQDDYIRQRDADQPSGYWDESRGDFTKPIVKASSKQQVVESVHKVLGRSTIH